MAVGPNGEAPLLLRDIKSVEYCIWYLQEQGEMRSFENDEKGLLLEAAHNLNDEYRKLLEFHQCTYTLSPTGMVITRIMY